MDEMLQKVQMLKKSLMIAGEIAADVGANPLASIIFMLMSILNSPNENYHLISEIADFVINDVSKKMRLDGIPMDQHNNPGINVPDGGSNIPN